MKQLRMNIIFDLVRDFRHFLGRETHSIGTEKISLNRGESSFFKKFGIQFAYGHREILLNAMGESWSSAFSVVLQHGVYTPNSPIESRVAWPPRKTLNSRYPFVCFSRFDEENVRKLGLDVTSAIGAPWLYLPLLQQSARKDNLGFFPTHHNLNSVTPNSKLEQIRKRISLVQDRFPGMSITVFLYYSEFLMREWHEAAEMYGFSVFCAGLPNGTPSFSPNPSRIHYLLRLRDKIAEMELCAFESFSSALIYSGSIQKPAALIQTPETELRIRLDPLESALLVDIFGSESSKNVVDGQNLQDLSLRYLGKEEMKSPAQLKAILEPVKLPSLEKVYSNLY